MLPAPPTDRPILQVPDRSPGISVGHLPASPCLRQDAPAAFANCRPCGAQGPTSERCFQGTSIQWHAGQQRGGSSLVSSWESGNFGGKQSTALRPTVEISP